MLTNLKITNYALIDRLEVDFTSGLSIITGETGAGKSVILGAIGLLRGRRADSSSLRDKGYKAIVEAVFDVSANESVKNWLVSQDYDLPDNGHLILRREVSPSGRSRAFINDSPANLQNMQEVTLLLLDIHSQHQTQQLADPRVRLSMIDSLAESKEPLTRYIKSFESYRNTYKRMERLKNDMELTEKRRAELQEQYDYLKELSPKPGEIAELESLFDLQSRANQLKEQIGKVRSALDGYTQSARTQIEESLATLRKMRIPTLDTGESNSLLSRLSSILIDLKDINGELEDLDGRIDDDPRQLARTEKRLDALYQAQIAFKTEDANHLPQIFKEVKEQLDAISNPEMSMPSLKEELKRRAEDLKSAAAELSRQRGRSAKLFSEHLQQKARQLGLPNLKFEARVVPVKMYSKGSDEVDFLCSFNKNQSLMPLEQTASGGEMSRLMLAMKAIVAGKLQLPTLIFDEIDTGISGEIASLAGKMMRDIASRSQVLTITHLPQVAACGNTNYKVYKQDNDKETLTRIRRLDSEERRYEIAKMLSGSEVGEAALSNADSLLNQF